jgi:hypothetical protein
MVSDPPETPSRWQERSEDLQRLGDGEWDPATETGPALFYRVRDVQAQGFRETEVAGATVTVPAFRDVPSPVGSVPDVALSTLAEPLTPAVGKPFDLSIAADSAPPAF